MNNFDNVKKTFLKIADFLSQLLWAKHEELEAMSIIKIGDHLPYNEMGEKQKESEFINNIKK